ncbi:glycosyltransferase [Ornithinimicrobium sp. W1665]|uniref:glycosyltransferase n=1 Tax=Ornithinimicrobium sp. W1665 TaxID=3416666 RepID=UPI003D6A2350
MDDSDQQRGRLVKDVVLVWFESAEPGTAAGQHLEGTLQRLDEAAVPVAHVVAQTGASRPGWIARVKRLALMQVRAVRAGGRERLLLGRMHPASLLPVALQKLRGGSVVLMVQGNTADMHAAYPFTARLPIETLFIKPTIAMSTSLVAPSAGILDWINHDLGLTTPRGFVLENGFNGDSVAAVSPISTEELAQMGLRHNGFVVFVGKFATWQGIDTILAALDSEHWPDDLPIVFVGDGADEPLVVAAAARDSRVHYVGRVSAERALAWTGGAAMSLAVRKAGPASERGVSPYKVLEAAALGTPVVATRVRGQSSNG